MGVGAFSVVDFVGSHFSNSDYCDNIECTDVEIKVGAYGDRFARDFRCRNGNRFHSIDSDCENFNNHEDKRCQEVIAWVNLPVSHVHLCQIGIG